MRFRPRDTWQEVFPDHVLPLGLELRMDMETGKNYARLCPGQVDNLVNDFADEQVVIEKLGEAATWDQPDCLRQLLKSCYYRTETLTPILCDAASRGFLDVCSVLLLSQADPLGRDRKGVTPLHRAVGNGFETAAEKLLQRCVEMGREDALLVKDDLGRSCLDFAREQDLGPVARRIEAHFLKRMSAMQSGFQESVD
eukprot:gnl/MRDRNA2_/MRDRNA2_45207_c0_seq1.p1 gnl/MRDRNA2_/MRDRNA2_45207_c0~~gnl/MRDRNA2_/MRDRNA2_45207_c0_seq1.p1  ORF type:complete len:197 (-),score=40.33 gnl/MRDRNA2_/MRDRNA2_45207_c0_seq1:3-593(-)